MGRGDLPGRFGSYEAAEARQLSPTEWLALGPEALVYAVYLGRVPVNDEATQSELAARLRETRRALGPTGHPAVLRPLAVGQDGRFAWFAAEPPGPALLPWDPSYHALDSLAQALAFLHDRHLEHGAVGPATLFLRPDGSTALAPWSPPGAQPPAPPTVSMAMRGLVFAAPRDVHAFAGLLPPGDPELREILDACTGQRDARPANGRALLVKLRSTSHADRFARLHHFDRWDFSDHLRRLFDDWLDTPSLVETSAFKTLLAEVTSGSPALTLWGPLGSGKSRLLGEMGEELRAAGLCVAAGRAGSPDGPVLDALADLAARGLELDETLGRARACSRPEDLTDLLVETSRALLAESPDSSLLWLFDDLDRADSRSAEAIRGLQARALRQDPCVSGPRFAVLLSLSADSPPELPNPIALEPLSRLETELLVRSAFGNLSDLDRFSSLVHQEAAGSPFHSVELLRDLVREGLVVARGSRWEIDPRLLAPGPLALPLHLPSGLAQLLDRRFADLDPADRRLLHALSLAHGEADVELLARVLARDADDLFDRCEPLVARRLLSLGRTEPETVAFRDSRVAKFFREMPTEDAPALHAAWLGAYLGRWGQLDLPGPLDPWLHPPEPTEQRERERRALVLARHARDAGDLDAERRWLPLAAASAYRVCNFREARMLYERLLAIGLHDPPALRLARLALLEVRRILGDNRTAHTEYREVIGEARRAADVRAEIEGILGKARLDYENNDHAATNHELRRGYVLSRLLDDSSLQCRALDHLARLHQASRHLGLAERAAREALAAGGTNSEYAQKTRLLLLALRIDQGQLEPAIQDAERLSAEFSRTGNRRWQACCNMAAGTVAFRMGDFARAEREYARSQDHTESIGDHWNQSISLLGIALVHMHQSRFKDASAAMGRVRRLLAAVPHTQLLEPLVQWHDGWLDFLTHKLRAALNHLQLGAKLSRAADNHGFLCYCLSAEAVVHCALGDHDSALKSGAEAVSVARATRNEFGLAVAELAGAAPQLHAWAATRQPAPKELVGQLGRIAAYGRRTRQPELVLKAELGLASLGTLNEQALCSSIRRLHSPDAPPERLLARADVQLYQVLNPQLPTVPWQGREVAAAGAR